MDVSCPRGYEQQTRHTPLLLLVNGTDRRTDAQPFHRPCSTCYAGNVNYNSMTKIYNIFEFKNEYLHRSTKAKSKYF